MVFFLIFDILCLLASLGMSVMVALMIRIWDTVNEKLGRTCSTSYEPYDYEPSCTCRGSLEDTWTMGKSKQVENSVFPAATLCQRIRR